MTTLTKLLALCLSLSVFSCPAQTVTQDKRLAFPGAEGFGKYTQGGRGGRVIVVDSLDDSTKARPGTLRYAVKAQGPRIVVFNVSGVINLVKPLEISEDYITIAGQTSPKGIVISGSETQIDADEVIIRYMRFRPGSVHHQGDAVTGKRHKNIIIDHCSLSWANDEVASFYNNQNFTLQYSLISESLNHAGHKKGAHGYGGIWGGANASFVNNVLAHHSSRNPRLNGYRLRPNYPQALELVDVRNNVIYNWSHNSAYGNEGGRFNLVNNVFKPGPADGERRFFQLGKTTDKGDRGQAYLRGNQMIGEAAMSTNNRLGVEVKDQKHAKISTVDAIKDNFLVDAAFVSPKWQEDYPEQTAEQAFKTLIVEGDVGANRNRHGFFQDTVDQNVLNDIVTGTARVGTGIIDSELQVIKSWQAYAEEFASETASSIPDEILTNSQKAQQWIDTLGSF
ncbi:pectate lyase family protein [Neptunicella marina]|uniref:Pectate lyase C n=1 Tax=Neptunicella marina TaxID=2125989 RepID=A0A8J6IUH0_9ALTE|nr:pectate lyase C [Neptunicella marina]MBC3765688.1 pectate lyase C [Neptunicella marina]